MIDIKELSSTGAWRLEEADEGIYFLVFDLPDSRVNKLSEAVLRDLDAILEALATESELKGLIVIGGKEDSGTFIAGADISEIRSMGSAADGAQKASQGQKVISRFASLPAVTLAAIHGNCLGGGTELALACDLRLATNSPKTRIGLPEVQLGILPGFGGSQRLPRLIGLMKALPIVLSGKPQVATKAAKLGLVDGLVYPGLLRGEAVAMVKRALERGGKSYQPRRPGRPWVQKLLEALPPGRSFIKKQALKNVLRKAGPHYPAPRSAIEAMVDGYALSLEKGLELEAKLVGELAASSICKNLIDLFLSSEDARRGSKADAAIEKMAEGERVGLLGAGVMGGGIASLLTRKNFRVRMKDISHESIQTGLKKVGDSFRSRFKRRRMSKSEMQNGLASITTSLDYEGFQSIPFVIEAIVENMQVKKQVFAELEGRLPEDAIIASNTSSLSITEMQKDLRHPDRFVGFHFFNPVERMFLVEIIRGEQTSDEAVAIAEDLARRLGKIPIPVGDGPGFLVNRLLAPYLNEAMRLFEEGYSPVAVDRAIRDFGMPMGPFELLDEVGLDVAAKVCKVLSDAFGERARSPKAMEQVLEVPGLLGKKSGRGFYLYKKGKKGVFNEELRKRLGLAAEYKSDDSDLWIKRLLYPMINEAALAMDEGISKRPSMVDLAMVLGTGFAPFRGGPLRYADSVGVKQICQSLENLKEPRLAPCDLLRKLASEDKKFYQLELDTETEEETTGAVQSAES